VISAIALNGLKDNLGIGIVGYFIKSPDIFLRVLSTHSLTLILQNPHFISNTDSPTALTGKGEN